MYRLDFVATASSFLSFVFVFFSCALFSPFQKRKEEKKRRGCFTCKTKHVALCLRAATAEEASRAHELLREARDVWRIKLARREHLLPHVVVTRRVMCRLSSQRTTVTLCVTVSK